MAIFPRVYDLFMALPERGRLGRWRRALCSPARGRVLEIGAGTELNFAHYGRGAWVVATDPDEDMLTRSRERTKNARVDIVLVVADAEALPFRDHAFDEATVGLAMCTIPRPALALAELRRTVRHHGRVRLLEHVRVAQPLLGRLQDVLAPWWRRVAGGCRLNCRTVETIAGSGLTLESIEPHFGGYVQAIVARVPLSD